MSEGPTFPKKTDADGGKPQAPPVQIERSDDPNFGKTSTRPQGGMPTMQGKQIGCGAGVFLLALLGVVLMLAGGALL